MEKVVTLLPNTIQHTSINFKVITHQYFSHFLFKFTIADDEEILRRHITTVSIPLSPFAPTVHSSDDLIDTVCKETPFCDLCEASLRPLTPSPSDPKSLASAMANVVLGNMTDNLGYIQSLIRHSKDPAAERALAQCAELYRPVVRFNIPQAIEAMQRGEFGFAMYVLGDAEKQTDSCQKRINSTMADDESSVALTAKNQLVKNLCDVAVSVIKSLMNSR